MLPAMSFTILGFCAFSHAMCAVQVTPDHLWPRTFWYSFTTLITQGLPENPPDDYIELLLLYGGVLFFSIFVMNIFIGVISEQYASEKEQGDVMFEKVRAKSCMNYLTHMSVLPCNLLAPRAAALLALGTVALTLMLQVRVVYNRRPLPGFLQLPLFVASQVVLFMASIQCRGKSFPWSERDGGKRYLWICEPSDPSGSREPRNPWIQQSNDSGRLVEAVERTLAMNLDGMREVVRNEVMTAMTSLSGRAAHRGPGTWPRSALSLRR
eukprot:s1268_g2.t1